MKNRKAIAMMLEKFNSPLVEREIDIPELEDGQVLVRLTASGICGSDVHMWKGEDPRNILPMIMGHEGIGVVEEVKGGKKSICGKELKPGDPVVWDRGMPCGKCHYCTVLKEPSLCPSRWAFGISKPATEYPYLNGCYASHLILRENTNIIYLGDNPSLDPAVLVPATCSGATTAHAFDLARPQPGDTVVIQGPGPLGIFGVDFARLSGAANIVVIGATPDRLDICREMGATHILNRRETSVEERNKVIMDLTNGRGADLVYEVACSVPAIEEGLQLVRAGGCYLSAGVAVPIPELGVDWFKTVGKRNIHIQGVWVSDTSHLVKAVSLVMARPEIYSKLITHRFALEDATEALSTVDRHESIKAVLVTPEVN